MTEQRNKIGYMISNHIIPAVPVPFTSQGDIHEAGQQSYVRWMSKQDIGGVALWVHTGRGLLLSKEQREKVFAAWKDALPNRLIICGAGASPGSGSFTTKVAEARAMAAHAKKLGADALLVFPPNFATTKEEIIDYHREIADVGLPLVLFYLYQTAGGISYSLALLDELMADRRIIGIKMATLDSVVTYQNVVFHLHRRHPDKLVITGEDRFLGYSIMLGATAALIGLGAVCTGIQVDMLKAHISGDFDRFMHHSDAIDHFAQVVFGDPVEKYIIRLLHVLSLEGIIPAESVYDPAGYQLDDAEKALLNEALQDLMNVL